ncbi:MAG: alcohol dehydrogenase catalytic domain-containing protein [Candidatus Bathyarchaeota archaeon]|nr:MAG: alcohol dehydrogenase catalytic domain-containing protein [Candidatus Bathyarchaeota archaeon]
MKAAVYYSLDNILIENRPIPKISSKEVLVAMKACGVCGSDLMGWYLKTRVPQVLGHEPSGVVVKVGKMVKEFESGDRVFVHHHVACLTCHYCRDNGYTLCKQFSKTHLDPGGFAEYFRVPAPNLQIDTLKIPPKLSFEEATLIEPVGCCLRALNKCDIAKSDSTVIMGAGSSGLIFTMLLRAFGASLIVTTDFAEYRLKAARQVGADLTVNPETESIIDVVKKATDGRGADAVIVAAPNVNAYLAGLELCRKGGKLCVFAPTQPEDFMRLSINKLFFSEIKLIPSYSTSHIETRMALRLIEAKRVDAKKLITHKFPLAKTADALQMAARNKNCVKVVVLNE